MDVELHRILNGILASLELIEQHLSSISYSLYYSDD